MSASQTFMAKVASFLPVVAVLVSIFILYGFATGNSAIIWFLLIVNFISGPACLFFYLLEVKKGVFKNQLEE